MTTPDDIAFRVGSVRGRPAIATDRPNLVVTTNAHWDHSGAHEAFDSIAVHEAEHEWVSEGINGLDVDDVRDCLRKDAIRPLPEDFRSGRLPGPHPGSGTHEFDGFEIVL